MREKDICLNFSSVQISNVQHSTVLSVIYHDKMNIMEQALSNFHEPEHFHLMKYFGPIFGQSWPVLGVAITASSEK